MIGAILGDMIGSPYEFDCNNIKSKEFPLFRRSSHFTDDSVMTLAVADGIMNAGLDADVEIIKKSVIYSMQEYGEKYPYAGYGGHFRHWLVEKHSKPYGSYGNGAAWLYSDDYNQMLSVVSAVTEVSHNHPEGIKGAKAAASVIWLSIHNKSKKEIKEFVEQEFLYDLSRSCDEIRPYYRHDESCQHTVPEAITAFLEGDGFEDVIRTAVSLGGDSDTLACIAGSMEEAYYGVPDELKVECRKRIPNDLNQILNRFQSYMK